MTMRFAALRVLTSGAMFYFALGLAPVAWLMWVAPLPLLLYRDQAMGWRRALAEPMLAYLGGGLAWWPYLSGMVPVPIAALAIAQPAVVFAAGMGLTWLARRRRRPLLATLMLPLTVASCELLVTTWSPHGSFGSIAYTQSDNLALMQLLAVTGLSGITALLCWVPAALGAAWWQRERALRLAGPALAVLALVLVAGSVRLGTAPAGASIRIALLADDAQLRAYNKAGHEEAVLAAYRTRLDALGEADLVLLPEKAFSLPAARLPWFTQQLQDISARRNALVVAGVNLLGTPRQNLALVAAPGRAAASYQKQHLVPGWETGFAPGTAPLLLPHAGGLLGVAICKDLDFPATLRAYRGAALLLVPAWDFGADAWLHSRMAMARSIEQGIPMARTAHEGRLTLSDGRGVVLNEAASSAGGAVLLQGRLVLGAEPTVYSRIGDSVGWLLAAIWLCSLGVLARTAEVASSRIGG